MSTRYNTRNPIESTDVRDMSDNAKNFDEFSNSTNPSFNDRLGVARNTISGISSRADSVILEAQNELNEAIYNIEAAGAAAVDAVGFERGAGDFVTGFTVMPGMRNVAWLNPAPTGDGNLYSWSGEVPPSGKVVPPNSTPETTGGFVNAWVPRTDEVLRSDLASNGGAGLITDTLKPVTWSGFAGGADKTGAIDSQAAFDAAVNAAKTQGTGIFVPKGTYKSGATLYDIPGDGLWLNKDFPGGINIPATLRGNCLLLTIANPDVPTKDPIYTRSALNISAVGQGANHCNAIRLKMLNYSTDTDGNTGVYAESVSADTGKWTAALHGEAHHAGGTHIGANIEAKSHTTLGVLYGIVVLNTGGDPTALHPVTGLPPVANPNAVGIYINGGAGNGDAGLWLYGVKAGADSIRAGGAVIRDEARTGAYGYRSTTGAVKTTAEIFLEGVAPTAIVLNGTYSTGNAIRMKTGDAIAYDSTGVIKTKYDATATRWGLFSGAADLVTFSTQSSNPGIWVNGIRVVSQQRAAIANAAAGTEIATINAILAAMRLHGLIAT